MYLNIKQMYVNFECDISIQWIWSRIFNMWNILIKVNVEFVSTSSNTKKKTLERLIVSIKVDQTTDQILTNIRKIVAKYQLFYGINASCIKYFSWEDIPKKLYNY